MSERIKPYGGSSSSRLTKLINNANRLQLVEGIDFEYATPVTVNSGRTNTKIAVRSKRPGIKSQFVNYNRLSIDALAHLPAKEIAEVVVTQWPVEIHSYLDSINIALGLDLEISEVINAIIEDNGQETLPLKITEKSIAWLPSEYQFKIRRNLIDLAVIWVNVILDGLYKPVKNV